MIAVEKMRTIEVRDQDGVWVLCEDMGRLEKGDVFRFLEPDGKWNGETYICQEQPGIRVDLRP